MARPNKIGLEYFPLDIDFFDDEKIEAIAGEFGIKGEIATVKLLCAIYRNGYYAVWNDMLKMKLLKRLPGISAELLEQIVNRLVVWGFFDKDLFNSEKVLTSRGIQTRYKEATKRRASNEITVYAVNNGVIVNKNPLTGGVNVNINAQSKVKESKVNPPLPPLRGDAGEKFPFDGFWHGYGKKVDRAKCEAKWAKIKEADRAKIMQVLPAYVAATPDVQYRKNPLTWLRGQCWNDESLKEISEKKSFVQSLPKIII